MKSRYSIGFFAGEWNFFNHAIAILKLLLMKNTLSPQWSWNILRKHPAMDTTPIVAKGEFFMSGRIPDNAGWHMFLMTADGTNLIAVCRFYVCVLPQSASAPEVHNFHSPSIGLHRTSKLMACTVQLMNSRLVVRQPHRLANLPANKSTLNCCNSF